MFSRVFRSTNFRHATLITALAATISTTAAAQTYPGGGGMGGSGSPGATMHPSYGSKGPVIGGIAGGAAGAGILYWSLHNRATLVGCVGGDGNTLVSKHAVLRPGERVEVRGKKIKDDSGGAALQIRKVTKDLGACRPTTAEKRPYRRTEV